MIVLYMVLFASFDMILEQEPFPSLSHETTMSSQGDTSFDQEISVLSGDHEQDCPDSENCAECHECHLGHCSVLLGSGLVFHNKNIELLYTSESNLFVSRNLHSVFRPPIKA